MKILVIGSGFLGSQIIKSLNKEGHEVLSFSRTTKSDLQIQQITGDIFSFEKLISILNLHPKIIINTAWITSYDQYTKHPLNSQYALFAIELAKMAAHFEIEHLVTLGSCAEYGFQSSPVVAGVTKLSPTDLYSRQKIFAFQSIKEILGVSQTRMTWARIFYPYGPHQDRNRLIPYLIDKIKNSDSVLLRDTTSKLDWISSRDVASAISWIITHELPEEVDIGTSQGFTSPQVFRHLTNLMKVPHMKFQTTTNSLEKRNVMVLDESSPILRSGWKPKDELSSGLEWILSFEKN
jgi:nucleoside-diphosphate-sugar epimerase